MLFFASHGQFDRIESMYALLESLTYLEQTWQHGSTPARLHHSLFNLFSMLYVTCGVPRRASGVRHSQLKVEAAHQATYASLTAMCNRDFGIDRYVRPMDSSSRFCQPCLDHPFTLTSKRGSNGRHKWTEGDHGRYCA